MKKKWVYIAIAALLLPICVRGLWFYRGFAKRPEIATPDFASFSAPQAPFNVSKTDEEVGQLGGTVLIDASHSNLFYMANIDSLTSAIQARSGKIEMVADSFSLENNLKYASAFVTFSPTLPYSIFEIEALKNFAERGGKIIVFTDATNNTIYTDYFTGVTTVTSDVNAANSLLREFDIMINNDYLYNIENSEGNFRNVFFEDFGKNELTFGLKEVALYGAHSVESPSGLILLRGTESTLSSANDAHSADQGGAALSADGNVAAFGDFTFLSSPYNAYTDNATLISNLADFVLGGSRSKSLANFPFLFEGSTVKVFVAPELTKTTELISALGGLQASLRYMGIEPEFVDEVPSSGNAIVIASFELTEDTEPFANKFDLVPDGDFITTTEFGDVGRYGNGILLFDAGTKGSTLVLLADTPEDTISLIGVVTSGSLYSCLTSEKAAVCSVGYGGDYYSSDTGEETTEEDVSQESTEGEATPEATPTPEG